MHQSVLLHHVWKFEIFFAFFQDFVGDYKEKQKVGGQQRRLKQANPTPFYMPMCLTLSENDGNPSNSSATFTKKKSSYTYLIEAPQQRSTQNGEFHLAHYLLVPLDCGKGLNKGKKKKVNS